MKNDAGFRIWVQILVCCSVCHRKMQVWPAPDPPMSPVRSSLWPGATIPDITLPDGWHTLKGDTVCDRHEIQINKRPDDDDEP